MSLVERHTIDKSSWPEGPWKQEPDFRLWKEETTGLLCLVVRGNNIGYLCGYVVLPKGHPLFGTYYGDPSLVDVEVHGGLTYSGVLKSLGNDPDLSNKWFLGFDCCHSFDCVPIRPDPYTYRDMVYVVSETEHLARQLFALGQSTGEVTP